MRRYAAAALLSLLPVLPALGQARYSNPELGFTLTIPEHFLGEAADPLGPRATIMCWIDLPTPNQSDWVRLCVERAGKSLPRVAQKMTFTWKGLDLEGGTFQSRIDDTEVVVFAAVVPLRKAAIWLEAFAPVPQRARAQAELVGALATLQGESSVSSTDRAERAGSRFGFVGAIIIAVGVGMWIMQRRQKKQSG